ncbi:LOW QUALITY PROTEIN: hypothetical protein HID58_046675, partial [Brassica napus]
RALAPSFLNAFLPFLRRKTQRLPTKKSGESVLPLFHRFTTMAEKKRLPTKTSGSGFVVSNNKILTNAHVVADHTFVQVRKHGSPTKFKAKVVTVGHDCDLAILKINSKKFWKDLKPLDPGDIPPLNGTVVITFPLRKVLSLELRLQNMLTATYIIPTPVVKHFITSVEENAQFPGFCSLGISCQRMENAGIRRLFKMTPKMTRTLIRGVNLLSNCYGILKEKVVEPLIREYNDKP